MSVHKEEPKKPEKPGKEEQEDAEDELPEDKPSPNYNQTAKYMAAASFVSMLLFLLSHVVTSFYVKKQSRRVCSSVLLLLGTRANLILFDMLSFFLVAPTSIDYSLEDEEEVPADFGEEGNYDSSQPTGFIEGLREKERRQELASKAEPKELEDVDVDVEVDGIDEGSEEERDDEEEV